MASDTAIANQALANLGALKRITNIDTDKSSEGVAARTFFDDARDATLRDFNWPFAARYVILAVVAEEPAEVNREWSFSYRYPTDSVKARRILSGLRQDNRQSRVPYKIASDAQGQLIYADEPEARLEYTARITDPTRFTADFVLPLSFRLAAYMAPSLTKGDPFQRQAATFRIYLDHISAAEASAAKEEQPDEEPDAELIREREGNDSFLPRGRGTGRPFGT